MVIIEVERPYRTLPGLMRRDRLFSTGLEPFNPERSLILKPSKFQTHEFAPNDETMFQSVWPMVEHAFKRYTADQNGNDGNGDRVSLTNDPYDTSGKSTTLGLSQEDILLGSLRLVIGHERPEIQPPIDAMLLMTDHAWPDPAREKFGEVGRFSLHPKLSRQEKILVQKRLYQEVIRKAQKLGIQDKLYVILASHVLRFVQDSGIRVSLCPGARINTDNEEARQVFTKYPVYWLPQSEESPQLYRYGV